ncbi:MAG: NAD-dependent epimerase/dehydratase family protein [Bradyrhizobium sp.]|uniref:NAD-dependent epimerase/dehydratase family protein n=1 Tax=Bradyrhizobium sp. TaxID=376 RepID=UPI0012216A17|nr:NAD-dependent epimerase/dehydratase family protein [Bradyrhizobium sp.]THD70209.1 MAG: NAD-dependent epimerase/dehydratase family protein [Bradyrhizobium sp.]
MKDGKPIVLVTGANGFIGRHLTPVLESAGWTVRRVLRTPTGGPNEIHIGSIGPAMDWQDALVDVDAIVHLAAHVHAPYEEHLVELHRTVNTEGTLNLARSAANAGVRRFVFISTILVNGRSSDGRAPFSETDPPTPYGVYGMSKAAAETGLEAIAQNGGMRVTVIRPPLVYGAGAKGNFRRLTYAIERGIPLPFASIDNRRAFLAVGNLTGFILERLSQPGGQFDVFPVADDEAVSTPEFIRKIARAAGTSARLFSVPPSVLSALFKISGRPEAIDSVIGSLQIDISKAVSTGWRPRIGLDEGLRLAVGASGPK